MTGAGRVTTGTGHADAAPTDAAQADAAQADAARTRRQASATLDAVTPDPQRFRQVLGHFATGVTVITGTDQGQPVGFACQAFAALSLEPPLVLFCPARSSSTWPRIASSGEFCANILADDQRDLARRFGVSAADKFSGVEWEPGSNGAPVLAGVLTWASCSVETVYEAGDHYVVIARVTELGDLVPGDPLLFYRGRFTLSVTSDGDTPPEVVDTLLAWPRFADWM